MEEDEDITEEEISDSEIAEDLFNKKTQSFRCLAQVLISRSSLLRHPLYHFPPLQDPGIDEAFNYKEPALELNDVGCENYLFLCKKFKTAPLSRVLNSLATSSLDLEFYGITEQQTRAIMDSLKINKHVLELNLEDNHLTPMSVNYISSMLESNTTLISLNLKECRIGPEGAEYLNDGIQKNKSLKILNLSCNSLENEGMAFMEDGLSFNMSIRKLILSHNNLGDEAAMVLGEILSSNEYLEDVDISWNRFYTLPAAKSIFNGLCQNVSLKALNISWNAIEQVDVCKQIAKFIKNAPLLEKFDVSNNNLSGQSLRTVSTALSKCKTLKIIKFGNNPAKPDDAAVLLGLLNKLPLVKYLDLENIFFEKSSLGALQRAARLKKDVIFGGILSNYTIKGPDEIKLLFDRANFLAYKTKKKIFGHFVLSLPDDKMDRQEFLNLFKKFQMKKVDKDLMDGIVQKFLGKKDKVETGLMKESFLKYYPDVHLPETSKPKPEDEQIIEYLVEQEQYMIEETVLLEEENEGELYEALNEEEN